MGRKRRAVSQTRSKSRYTRSRKDKIPEERSDIDGEDDCLDFNLSQMPFTTSRKVDFLDDKLVSEGFLPPRYEQERVGKEFSHIRRPLVAHALGRRVTPVPDGNLIAITSSLSGEGKTFVSIQLAISMAKERDIDVVLVDGDFPKGDLSRLFDVEKNLGFADVVSDPKVTLSDVLLKTNKKRIWFVPAGVEREDGLESLSGEHVEQVMESFKGLGSKVITIFDTPPLTLISEANVITGYTGQILLVVKANATPRQKVLDAIELVDSNPEKSISLLLNQADRPSFAGYGAGEYGYPAGGAK